MNLLLDTHIWIWLTLEPERLANRVMRALDEAENQLWISPVSVWELLLLTRKGRVQLNEDAVSWARRTIEKLALREALPTVEVAYETESLGLPHGDPADRWLAATAKVFDLTLVTADEKLIGLRGIHILANR